MNPCITFGNIELLLLLLFLLFFYFFVLFLVWGGSFAIFSHFNKHLGSCTCEEAEGEQIAQAA